jgi:hypothetical protein
VVAGQQADNVQRRQEFLEGCHRARPESRRHYELSRRAGTLDQPGDSPAVGAAGAVAS